MTTSEMLEKVTQRRQMMHFWYCIYMLGGLVSCLMALTFTDACSAMIIGALAFWLTVSTFLTYPAMVKQIQKISSLRLKAGALLCGVVGLWMFAGFAIIAGILAIPLLLELVSPAGTGLGRAGLSVILMAPLLGHGMVILCAEDTAYEALEKCMDDAHLPKSFREITALVEFCEARDLKEEAIVISKTTLALAEHGYFTKAA